MTRRTVIAATLACVAFGAPATVAAQELMLGAHAGLGSGVELGDPGNGTTAFRRARTRVVVGVDGRVDETPKNGLGAIVFAEVEPHFSLGAELRYKHFFNDTITGFAGGTGVIAPNTLFGGVAGLQIHIPFDDAGTTVFFEPSFSALPLGSDLPGDRIVMWGLLTVGVHAKL